MMKRRFFAFLLACLPLSVLAADVVEVARPWARATVPGQDVGAAYMDLKSASGATLIAISSPVSDAIEIHKMAMNRGVMEMRMLEELPLPAGKTVKLEPNGFHLMLFDLKKPLNAGDRLPLTLTLRDKAGKTRTQRVSVPIKSGVD